MIRMSDHNRKNDDKGNSVLSFENCDGLQKLELGRDDGMGPTGHKERRGDGIEALPSNVGSLDTKSEGQHGTDS